MCCLINEDKRWCVRCVVFWLHEISLVVYVRGFVDIDLNNGYYFFRMTTC
jgi:hypothetical protein